MRRRKSGMRKAVLLLFLVSGLGVAGIALMAAYDDAHTAAGASVAGGPAHNPMPPQDMLHRGDGRENRADGNPFHFSSLLG